MVTRGETDVGTVASCTVANVVDFIFNILIKVCLSISKQSPLMALILNRIYIRPSIKYGDSLTSEGKEETEQC